MIWRNAIGGALAWLTALSLLVGGCTKAPGSASPRPSAALGRPVASATDLPPADDARSIATRQLLGKLNTFRVAGVVRTDGGLLLPEYITILVRSEVCVESREPGSRFWSLDYDTCFVYSSVDSLDEKGEYSGAVPCLDADQSYESRHVFGDLRLVQRGPVSFLAESDAGWKHQETFTSSRNQRRDLVLTLETDTFWVVTEGAPLQAQADAAAATVWTYPFGSALEVVRFHRGWAECLMGLHMGWVEMRHLGTEAEMRRKEPLMGKPVPQPRAVPE